MIDGDGGTYKSRNNARRGERPTSDEASARRKAATSSRRWPSGKSFTTDDESLSLSLSLVPSHSRFSHHSSFLSVSHVTRAHLRTRTNVERAHHRSKDPPPTIDERSCQASKIRFLSISGVTRLIEQTAHRARARHSQVVRDIRRTPPQVVASCHWSDTGSVDNDNSAKGNRALLFESLRGGTLWSAVSRSIPRWIIRSSLEGHHPSFENGKSKQLDPNLDRHRPGVHCVLSSHTVSNRVEMVYL